MNYPKDILMEEWIQKTAITNVRVRKEVMEGKILDMLTDFECECGVSVSRFNLTLNEIFGELGSRVVGVNATIEL